MGKQSKMTQLEPAYPKKREHRNAGRGRLVRMAIQALRAHNYARALGCLLVYEAKRKTENANKADAAAG
jgi:hypothetical protein